LGLSLVESNKKTHKKAKKGQYGSVQWERIGFSFGFTFAAY
jgi:hypothetical protein